VITALVGDIFTSAAPVLVDPVNCVGIAGAGLALQFRRRFPAAHRAYVGACEAGALAPGRPFVVEEGARTIVFLATKRHWRDLSQMKDVMAGIAALRVLIEERGWMHVAVPALGCGLGGLEWLDVQRAVHAMLEDVAGVVELYAPKS
jgi:O-acetyl-ADP-ribose deacetylase (regulator of RNase III)